MVGDAMLGGRRSPLLQLAAFKSSCEFVAKTSGANSNCSPIAPRGFQVVLKGGRPWGFTLAGGGDGKPLVVAHVEVGGKAWCEGNLRVGDQVVRINDVFCYSVPTAQQLIDGAFRTLTLAAWRASTSSHDREGHQQQQHSVARRRSSAGSQRQHQRTGSGTVACEGIYENVGGQGGGGGGGSGSSRVRPPGMEKERDRRSLRKLTKDSGYETSPYSESDYANVDCWSDQASSDRSAVVSPQPRSFDHHGRHHLRSSSSSGHFSPPALDTETWRRRSSCLGWAASSPDSLNNTHHTSSSTTGQRPVHQGQSPSRRRQASSSSSSSSSTCLGAVHKGLTGSPPPYSYHQQQQQQHHHHHHQEALSMAGSRSTPILNRAEDHHHHSHRHNQKYQYQQGQQHLTPAEAAMVARKFRRPSVYETLATKSGGLQFAPVIHGRPPQPWDGLPMESGSGSGLHQRSASACQLFHSRQTSTQSSTSDGTATSASSSSYAGCHSRQLSSLSSYSEEDEESSMYSAELGLSPRHRSSQQLLQRSFQVVMDREGHSNLSNVSMDSGGRCLSPPPPPPPARDSSSMKLNGRQPYHCRTTDTCPQPYDQVDPGNGYHQQYYYFFCATGTMGQQQHQPQSAGVAANPSQATAASERQRSAQVHRLRKPHQFHPQQQQALLQPQYAVMLTSSSSSSSSSSLSSSHGDANCGSTPLLDRLRSESQRTANKLLCSDTASDSGVTGGTGSTGRASVSSTASSQETLKWHGSCGDISTGGDRQPGENVAHSARVQPPERHNSESVLYYGGGGGEGGEMKPAPPSPPRNDSPPPLPAKTRRWADQVQKKNRLNRNGTTSEPSSPPSPTLAALPHQHHQQRHQQQQQQQQQQQSPSSPEEHRAMTVAERVLHLERGGRPTYQQQARRSSDVHSTASTVLHEQRPRAGDPSLKAIQKQAVLSFFERQTGITSSRSSIRDRDVVTSSPTFMPRQSTRSLPRDSYQEFKRQQQLQEAEAASSAALAAAEAAAASMDALVYRDLAPSSSSSTRLNSDRQQTSYLDATPSKSSCSPLNVGAVAPVMCQSEAGDEKCERPQSAVEQAHSLPVSKNSTDLPQKSNSVNAVNLTEELQRCELRGSLRRSFLTKQGSRCSTPELPLPPPPRTTETEVAPTDEPLPPPPTLEEVDCVVESKNLSWERMHRPCFHSSSTNLVLHSTLDMVKESSPIREVTQIVTECVSDDDPIARKGSSDSAIEDTTSSSDSPAPDDKRGSSSFSSPFIEVDSSSSGSSSPTPTPSPVPPRIQEARAKRVEDLEVERLSRDLVNYLPASDQKVLHNILVLAPEMKTMSDYMEGIFVSSNAHPQRRRRSHNMINNNNNNVEKSFNEQRLSREGESLPADSAYFTTSESKARFLTTYSKDMSSVRNVVEGSNLLRRKEELIGTIARKLDILRAELLAVHEEMGVNDELGNELTCNVERLARINETDKFKLHVEEVEKITNLLLGLSGRLARAENALKNLPQDHNPDEKRILESKRNKLYDQHEEAKKLKENIDRRSVQVSAILGRYLSAEEHEDYNHFIKMKSKLLMDAREIDDKIKLGEEQMAALQQSLLSWCKP